MDSWETLKSILQGDLEAWDEFASQLSNALDHEKDITNRHGLQATLAPILIYQETTKHYIHIMEQLESGVYPEEVEDDGGST
jgi:hypothetical protein